MIFESSFDIFWFPDVTAVEFEVAFSEYAQERLTAEAEVIQHTDPMALHQEPSHQHRSDIPGAAGDENCSGLICQQRDHDLILFSTDRASSSSGPARPASIALLSDSCACWSLPSM